MCSLLTPGSVLRDQFGCAQRSILDILRHYDSWYWAWVDCAWQAPYLLYYLSKPSLLSYWLFLKGVSPGTSPEDVYGHKCIIDFVILSWRKKHSKINLTPKYGTQWWSVCFACIDIGWNLSTTKQINKKFIWVGRVDQKLKCIFCVLEAQFSFPAPLGVILHMTCSL